VGHIEAILRLKDDPTTLLVGSQNQGAYCGGGTPASIWRLTLDPQTGLATNISQQALSQIQMLRQSLFESSDGTLFTGSGWCGFKPPYYSTDHGLTWAPATTGSVYPQNSAFSYAELKHQVYVGTGYNPYDGIVYRWLGNGAWSMVLDVPEPRNIVDPMTVYEDHLFVAPSIYQASGCESSIPVYISDDGTSFRATSGIPNCDAVQSLLAVGGQLFALTAATTSPSGNHVYAWHGATETWSLVTSIAADTMSRQYSAAYGNTAYLLATVGTGGRGLYETQDWLSWTLVAPDTAPGIYNISVQGHTLYAGDNPNGGTAHVYTIELCP
jgi:hypothetical protein